MDLIWEMSRFFLICVGLGVSLFTVVARTEQTGVGFFKVATAVSAGAILISFCGDLYNTRDFLWYNYFHVASLIVMLSVYLIHRDKKNWLMWIFFILQNVVLTGLLYSYSGSFSLKFGYMLSGALFLGVITYSMLLGHWYLVTPKLSERPLVICMYMTWGFLFLKAVISGVSLYGQSEFFSAGTSLGAGYMFNWMILLMRVGWGYVIIGIMSYFAYRLIKMRSIQSATGILYVMTFFVFIGELLSSYILFKYGLYI